MKIISDSENKDLKNYLLTILSDEIRNDQTNQIVLKLKKNKYSILNTNYKDDPLISIDYTSEKYSNRINKRMEQKDIFLKLFKKKSASILDCTAGFGRDAYLLSKLGYMVTMIEKNPIVSLVVKNALENINQERLSLYHGDSLDFLRHTNTEYDYIYFDFMFKKAKTKSLASKHDETLRCIGYREPSEERLIQLAQQMCKKSVIVKGPKNSIKSNTLKANHRIQTKLLNYDIFISSNG